MGYQRIKRATEKTPDANMTILPEDGTNSQHSTKNIDENIQRRQWKWGSKKNEEGNLYNKYAYDYLYTREGEERGGKQERGARERFRGNLLGQILEY